MACIVLTGKGLHTLFVFGGFGGYCTFVPVVSGFGDYYACLVSDFLGCFCIFVVLTAFTYVICDVTSVFTVCFLGFHFGQVQLALVSKFGNFFRLGVAVVVLTGEGLHTLFSFGGFGGYCTFVPVVSEFGNYYAVLVGDFGYCICIFEILAAFTFVVCFVTCIFTVCFLGFHFGRSTNMRNRDINLPGFKTSLIFICIGTVCGFINNYVCITSSSSILHLERNGRDQAFYETSVG